MRATGSAARCGVKFSHWGGFTAERQQPKAGVTAHLLPAAELTRHGPLKVRLVKAIGRKRVPLQQRAWTERNVTTQASQEAAFILPGCHTTVPESCLYLEKQAEEKLGGLLVTSAKDPAQDETQTRPPRTVRTQLSTALSCFSLDTQTEHDILPTLVNLTSESPLSLLRAEGKGKG